MGFVVFGHAEVNRCEEMNAGVDAALLLVEQHDGGGLPTSNKRKDTTNSNATMMRNALVKFEAM